jgi:hypothetical protein
MPLHFRLETMSSNAALAARTFVRSPDLKPERCRSKNRATETGRLEAAMPI